MKVFLFYLSGRLKSDVKTMYYDVSEKKVNMRIQT